MKGTDVVERALALLNYTDRRGKVDKKQAAEIYGRCLPLLNSVLADLLFIKRQPLVEMASIMDDVPLDEATVIGVMLYGVAMMMAQSESDGDNQQLFAALYNQKRNTVTRENGRFEDKIPAPT